MSQRITESASVAVVCMYWMIHCIKWSLKKKIKNDISKEEKFKSETQIKIISQKMFEKIISACIEWLIVLNDHWRWKWKNEISKVEKLKSENQKINISQKCSKIF